MTVNFADLSASLEIMWKGMAGLFLVCGVVMLFTMLASRFLTKKREPDSKNP